MFRSIRFRLILSYILITLLTVAVVGAVGFLAWWALWLVPVTIRVVSE